MDQPIVIVAAIAALFLVAAVGLIIGRLTDHQGKRLQRRLDRIGGRRTRPLSADAVNLRLNETNSAIPALDRAIKRYMPQPKLLRIRLERTGRRISLGEYVLASVFVGIASFGLLSFFSGLPSLVCGLLAVTLSFGLPHYVVGYLVNRRRNRFILLLPEAIDLIVRGLRSGLPITESIRVVGQEIPDPVGTE